jgi:rhodanese-related sulfurtransferase
MTDTAPIGAPAGPDVTLEEAGALAPLVAPNEGAARVAAGAVLVDVRSAAGRAAAGTVPGAVVVDRYALHTAFDLTSAGVVPGVTSPATPIVVLCGSVRGSGPVAAALLARGFTDVVHVEGGFPAWRDAGLPADPPGAPTA